MWITYLSLRWLLQSFVRLPWYFSLWLFSSIVETGYIIYRALESLYQSLLDYSIFQISLDSFLRLLILALGGLCFFLSQFSLPFAPVYSIGAQGINNVDWMGLFIQYVLPLISGGAIGGFFGWLSNRALQKKSDAEAVKLQAEANKTKSETFLNEFDKLVDEFKIMVQVRDVEIKLRGDIIATKDKEIETKDMIIRHMRNSLDYLRGQAQPFVPIAVQVSYEIEYGKRDYPYQDDATNKKGK